MVAQKRLVVAARSKSGVGSTPANQRQMPAPVVVPRLSARGRAGRGGAGQRAPVRLAAEHLAWVPQWLFVVAAAGGPSRSLKCCICALGMMMSLTSRGLGGSHIRLLICSFIEHTWWFRECLAISWVGCDGLFSCESWGPAGASLPLHQTEFRPYSLAFYPFSHFFFFLNFGPFLLKLKDSEGSNPAPDRAQVFCVAFHTPFHSLQDPDSGLCVRAWPGALIFCTCPVPHPEGGRGSGCVGWEEAGGRLSRHGPQQHLFSVPPGGVREASRRRRRQGSCAGSSLEPGEGSSDPWLVEGCRGGGPCGWGSALWKEHLKTGAGD
nr:uncharacterized protein LOC127484449 [Oryctolagus cuniculus]XP_051681289.1 uncharacterized protein LOC127484449 [Oryctolagus cuniculus]